MAWKDKLNTVFEIITGDGKRYTPLWKPTSKVLEWNIAEFEFPNVDGTLVIKSRKKGRKIPIDFYFQGDDHLDLSLAFENSSNDLRPWKLIHPYYGEIICHCPQLNIDHSDYGISHCSATVIETITEDAPKSRIDPVDKVIADKERLDELQVTSFDVEPTPSDINTLANNANKLYTEGAKSLRSTLEDKLNKLAANSLDSITNTVQTNADLLAAEGDRALRNTLGSEDYFNAFNKASSAIQNATEEPFAAIKATQELINTPALFKIPVENRVNLLRSQFSKLRDSIPTSLFRSDKKIYEQNAGCLISALLLAAVSPLPSDFKNSSQVLVLVSPIIDSYNEFIEDLDALQTENGGSPDSFIPDAATLIALNSIVNYTVSNLFTIAAGSKQERSIILDVDSNWILLAHRLYGVKDDSRIEELMNNNNSSLNDILQVKKGKRVVYYI